MAEPVAAGPFGGLDLRRTGLIASVSLVIVIALVFMIFRGCSSASGGKGYTTIYSGLELKDAANVVARLKELKIPYEIKESGQAIAVPKDHADSARLGLAEKNLPLGGAVGWEIFDESKLGATSFDRRIQLIRAISGELSRTIRTITAVENARVQIVMPETKLFETESVPVTASVLLRLKPGTELIKEKVNGIVHLVASSVENLQTENVTVIDQSGKILTVKEIYVPPIQEVVEETVEIIQETPVTTTTLVQKETTEEVAMIAVAAPLMPEERMLLKVRAKKELERDLAGKAQEILNRFYPPNSVIIKVETETNGMPVHKDYKLQDLEIKKLNAIVLVDNRVDLTKNLKDSTYKSVAAAVGYNKKRGDKILLQKVPFHLATPPLPVVKEEVKKSLPPPQKKEIKLSFAWFKIALWVFGIGLVLLVISSLLRRKKKPSFAAEVPTAPVASTPPPSTRKPGLNQLKNVAEQNPEKIADLLRSWLSE